MFDHHCSACGKRQLVPASRVTQLVNDEQGIVVLLTCWCGEPAALRTGRPSVTRVTPAPTPTPVA